MEHAVADGCDVRGLLYWTLVDNFEWAFGWAPRFGLFRWEVDEPSQVGGCSAAYPFSPGACGQVRAKRRFLGGEAPP